MPYNKNDPQTIRALFDSIAKQYDRTNSILSFQMHKKWNGQLIQQTIAPAQPKVLLDLCCGTGAIAFEYLRGTSLPVKTFMLDFSERMLEFAREKAKRLNVPQHEIVFLKADAQNIPLMDSSIDCATIAYGIRNVSQPLKCISDVYRVLAPGGTFGILELTQPENKLLRIGHRLYLKTMLPLIGKILTSNQEAYQYLCNSIHSFIPPNELEKLMLSVGFANIQKISFCGGIATLLIGKKK